MSSISVPFAITFIVFISFLLGSTEGAGSGSLTWGDTCNPTASLHDDHQIRCNTGKRLSCNFKTRTCSCHHEERDFYNKVEDRCETKVGSFCSASETFPTNCVKNAVCDATTNFCVCDEGAEKNEDDTACIKEDIGEENGAAPRSPQNFIYLLIAFSTIRMGLW